MDITKRIEAEKAKLDAAKAAITPEDLTEIEQRKELADLEAERLATEKKKRDLDLDRRLMLAEEAKPDLNFEAVSVQGFSDTFIVFRNGKAYASWRQAQNSAAAAEARGKGPIDRNDIDRKYALAVVYDWNGTTDFDVNAESTDKLRRHLINNPGLVTPITDASAKLVGVFAEERKSIT